MPGPLLPSLYTNILLYLPLRPSLARLQAAPASANTTKFSVVLLLIDSLSQLNLRRSLPQTRATLESLGGVLFTSHHKVGGFFVQSLDPHPPRSATTPGPT